MQIERKDLRNHAHAVRNRRLLPFVIIAAALCLLAERSPAPIVETPANPTPAPAPQQTSAPKEKRFYKSKSQTTTTNKEPRQPSVTSGPARFSGSWSGIIQQGMSGTPPVSFFIHAEGTSVRMKEGEHPAVVNGNTITWKNGWFNEISWTLTPQTSNSAVVTSNSAFGVNGTATFTKTMSVSMTSSAPSSQPTATPRPNPETANLPTAKQVPGKPGFVYNPFDSSREPGVFDVRSRGHGAIMRDPASSKLFIIP